MLKSLIPFDRVHQLAKTDIAYAIGDRTLAPFYKYDLNNEAFRRVIADKSQAKIPRETLVQVLEKQYQNLPGNALTLESVRVLGEANTFTVTTAHQPCLFLGPLYFIYKALTTINLAEAALGLVSGSYRVVPVFVLGSEDHDLEEVNHTTLFGKRLEWQPGLSGPVGDFPTDSLAPLLERLRVILGEGNNAEAMFTRVQRAYDGKRTFAEATQALLHDLFGRFGLVVLNMNDPALKRHFVPIMRAELTEQPSFKLVSETTERLNALGFKTQAAPREINLFYMKPGLRERIVLEDDTYRVLNTDLTFSRAEILAELEAHPEHFSPNVVLRPLFQETILPNLAYVGGGGELAYWLERKSLFEHFGVNFPLLVRRNSVVWLDRDAVRRLQRFGFSSARIFDDTETLIKTFIENNADAEVNLSLEIADLRRVFNRVAEKAEAIDPTLVNAVRADEVKFADALAHWQSRLLRAEKAKHEVTINQIRVLKERLFPGGGLQERQDNFMQFYLRLGEQFFNELKEKLLPLERGFVVLEDR